MRIGIIGAGNVAQALAKALSHMPHKLVAHYIRNENSRGLIHSPSPLKSPDFTGTNAELIFVAVSDESLPVLWPKIKADPCAMLVHCSGAMPMLKHETLLSGVCYPLQTITAELDLANISLTWCLEAASSSGLEKLQTFCALPKWQTKTVDTEARLHLHLAAVWSNNFSTLLYRLAEEEVRKAGFDKSILFSLWEESLRKAKEMDLRAIQTGPARRNDQVTIKKHIDLLGDENLKTEIYTLLSQYIRNEYTS
jgi:predicted short-subunit dehydrogenase-like oxidoreductase (DUF2520 family)